MVDQLLDLQPVNIAPPMVAAVVSVALVVHLSRHAVRRHLRVGRRSPALLHSRLTPAAAGFLLTLALVVAEILASS